MVKRAASLSTKTNGNTLPQSFAPYRVNTPYDPQLDSLVFNRGDQNKSASFLTAFSEQALTSLVYNKD
jgi:hypothetical protein